MDPREFKFPQEFPAGKGKGCVFGAYKTGSLSLEDFTQSDNLSDLCVGKPRAQTMTSQEKEGLVSYV